MRSGSLVASSTRRDDRPGGVLIVQLIVRDQRVGGLLHESASIVVRPARNTSGTVPTTTCGVIFR